MHEYCRCGFLVGLVVVAAGGSTACDESARRPAAFSPTQEMLRTDGRIARCNTVHSLTLPREVIERYELSANEDTAIISCSLQKRRPGVPVNIPAQIAGTQTTLTGVTSAVDFKEVLEEGVITYVAPFSIAGKLAIDFRIVMVDAAGGGRYTIDLRQDDLPGRA